MTTKQLNTSSDVYSFGIILLQLITGKGAKIIEPSVPDGTIHISLWIGGKNVESIVDSKLEAGTYSIESVRKVKETAMACLRYTRNERPNINSVRSELEDALKIETTTSRTEFFTSQTFEINHMDPENRKMEGRPRTWLSSIFNRFWG